MKITIVGTGYVGLVSGACFAAIGNTVTCVDMLAEKVSSLTKGKLPFFEPGLGELISGNTSTGSISFTTDLGVAVVSSNVVIIAVGTPSTEPEGEADLTFVFEALRQVMKHLKDGSIIVVKSTVPIGTNRQIEKFAKTLREDINFDIVSNPEFLREGTAVSDFMEPDRIIVGAESAKAIATMQEVYRPLTLKGVPILFTDFETAETIKYAANAFLATKISFINEIAGLCDLTGANIIKVSKGMG
ncbi:MAG: nucleotide sugar dehydrogenase, partial [Gammaproteobacteria bacterium]